MNRILSFAILLAFGQTPAFAHAEGVFEVPATHAVSVPGTDLNIVLMDVIDQRCPSAVDCYWEGMKRVRLELSQGQKPPVTIILCNMCDDGTDFVDAIGHRLTFLDLLPSVEEIEGLGRDPIVSDYRVALVVDGN